MIQPRLSAPQKQILKLLATAVVAVLTYTLSDEAFLAWGWRSAFLLSIVLVGVGLFVRLKILETPEFARIKDTQRTARVPVDRS